WARRRPAVAALLAVVAFTACMGFGLVAWKWRDADQARRAEAGMRQQAEEALDRAEANLYMSRTAWAYREWSRNEAARAVPLLDECPPHRRSWEWHYLRRLCHPEVLTCALEESVPVTGLAFSPDGKWLALSGSGTVMVRDAAHGRQRYILRVRVGEVTCLGFSP